MILRVLRKLKFNLSPPKPGDVYYGDCVYFVVGSPVEHVLHQLKDKYGNSIWNPVPSSDCYRLTVVEINSSHYNCLSEVFCRGTEQNNNIGNWKKRTQSRRFPRSYFKELVGNGLLKKEK